MQQVHGSGALSFLHSHPSWLSLVRMEYHPMQSPGLLLGNTTVRQRVYRAQLVRTSHFLPPCLRLLSTELFV